MSDQGHFEKPEPERTGPYRQFFRPGPLGGTGQATARPSNGSGDPGWTGVVERSVEAGYRIVDEQLRFGQEVAERLSSGLTGVAGPGAVGGLEQMAMRMMRSTLDLAGLWVEMMSSVPATMGSWMAQAAPVGGTAASGGVDQGPALSIESSRPVEVSFDLEPRWRSASLAVQPLRSATQETALQGIELETADDGRLRLRLVVPDELPGGVYTGAIFDPRTGVGRGTLTVRVG